MNSASDPTSTQDFPTSCEEVSAARPPENATDAVLPVSACRPPQRLYDSNFLLAFVSQVCFVIANTLLAHFARWIEFLGGSLSQIGWIMGTGVAAGLLLRPTLAQFINRWGAKTTWFFGLVIFCVSSLANWQLDGLQPLIYLVRAGNILGAAFVFASSLTYIAQIAPEHRRTEAIGILGVGGFLGMLIGPFLGDLFLGSEIRERSSFLNLFLVAILVNLIPMILLNFLRNPASDSTNRSLSIREFANSVRQFWPGRILAVDFVFGICMTIPFVFLVSYIDETQLRFEWFSEVGYYFWFYASVGIFLRVTLRRLPERIGAKRVLLLGTFAMSLGMLSFWAVNPQQPELLFLPATLCGVGHSLMFHTMTSLTIEAFPRSLRGTGSALALMMLDLGTFLGAPALGIVGDRLGYPAVFTILALVLIGISLFYAFETGDRSPGTLSNG